MGASRALILKLCFSFIKYCMLAQLIGAVEECPP